MRTHVGKFLNVLGPGSAEHKGLTVWPNLANDFPDLRLETHVKHAVGLVHDQVSNATKVRLLGLQHVNQTTGSSDDYLDTTLQVANLRPFRRTTIDSGVTYAGVRAKLRAFLLYLDSKFSGGSQNESDRAIAR